MLLFFLQISSVVSVDPDALRSFGEVCTAHGYQFEAHNVTTADGYILTLFRIPGSLASPLSSPKPVVFLQHGLLDLADTWLMDLPSSPAFMFSDAGFDVWLGNSRGSFHSLGHVTYNYNTDPQYWQFTWQHMADYDIPAVIPFVLQHTGQAKLSYVGHSQGTLQMFAHLAADPSFMNYLNVFIALAPVGTVRHLEIFMMKLVEKVPILKALEDVGVYQFLPNYQENDMFYQVCSWFGPVCNYFTGFFADKEVDNDNKAQFPTILAHEPGGTSILNMQHWQQMVNYPSYKVQKFDFGKDGNMEKYGQSTPPVYDLTKLPGPIALFSGSADRLADPTDVKWLESVIPDSSMVYKNEWKGFGHLTFIWGKPALMENLYQQIFSIINKFK
jgi:pimeloyl-ACP methyl ester carboxylesterase